jgi:hypothetical protein
MSKERERYVEEIPMFSCALQCHSLAEICTQSTYSSMHKWAKMLCTGEYYSAIEKNDTLLFTRIWMSLEDIM